MRQHGKAGRFLGRDPSTLERFLGSSVKSNSLLILLLLFYIAVRSMWWHRIPIWDARWAYQVLHGALNSPFDLLNFCLDGHVSQGLFLLVSLPLKFFNNNFVYFNAWITLLGVLAIIGFCKLLEALLADRFSRAEILLWTAIFAFHPSMLSTMVHFNVDIGVITFGLWFWLMLLRGAVVHAAFWATLAIFSKETAIILIPLLFSTTAALQPRGQRVNWCLQHVYSLAIPYALLIVFLSYKTLVRGEPALWIAFKPTSPLDMLYAYFRSDSSLLNFLGLALIINFNWLILSIWGFLLSVVAIRHYSGGPAPSAYRDGVFFALFAVFVFVLTLVRPFSNVRYVAPLVPIMLIGLAQSSTVIDACKQMRLTCLLILLTILGFQNWRTIDPFSKYFFGTLPFGAHEILQITHRTSECCALGRDQLVYNAEFNHIPELLDEALVRIQPTVETFIVCPMNLNWYIFSQLDRTSLKMTLRSIDTFSPHYCTIADLDLSHVLPLDVYYIAFPNGISEPDIRFLDQHYKSRSVLRCITAGYELDVFHFHGIKD